jgi:hypothetical protein
MAKNRPRVQTQRQQPNSRLAKADTFATTSVGAEGGAAGSRTEFSAERLSVPDDALFVEPKSELDWGKLGFLLAAGVALVTALFHYANLTFSVGNLTDEMKDQKVRVEGVTKSTVDLTTRVNSLEQSGAQRIALPPAVPAPERSPATPENTASQKKSE